MVPTFDPVTITVSDPWGLDWAKAVASAKNGTAIRSTRANALAVFTYPLASVPALPLMRIEQLAVGKLKRLSEAIIGQVFTSFGAVEKIFSSWLPSLLWNGILPSSVTRIPSPALALSMRSLSSSLR